MRKRKEITTGYKPTLNSRGPNVDMEKCQKNSMGRYNLVLIAATRARELQRRNNYLYSCGETPKIAGSFAVDALFDIESGKIDPKFYLQNMIELNRSFPTKRSMQLLAEAGEV